MRNWKDNTRIEKTNDINIKTNAGSEGTSGINSKEEVLIFENRIARKPNPMLDVRWFTTSEAAQYLRVSTGSIKNMVYRGRLSPRKLGRLNRFLRELLSQHPIQQCQTG